MPWIDAALAAAALAVALAVKPWRAQRIAQLPWPALAWSAVLPVLWSADRLSAVEVLQPLAGSCLLMLMLGWPWAVLLVLGPVAACMLAGGVPGRLVLDHAVWLGVMPATLAMMLGFLVR